MIGLHINALSANPTKWSNTLKQFVGKLPTNSLSVFDHFVGLALKGLMHVQFTSPLKLIARYFEQKKSAFARVKPIEFLDCEFC